MAEDHSFHVGQPDNLGLNPDFVIDCSLCVVELLYLTEHSFCSETACTESLQTPTFLHITAVISLASAAQTFQCGLKQTAFGT